MAMDIMKRDYEQMKNTPLAFKYCIECNNHLIITKYIKMHAIEKIEYCPSCKIEKLENYKLYYIYLKFNQKPE